MQTNINKCLSIGVTVNLTTQKHILVAGFYSYEDERDIQIKKSVLWTHITTLCCNHYFPFLTKAKINGDCYKSRIVFNLNALNIDLFYLTTLTYLLFALTVTLSMQAMQSKKRWKGRCCHNISCLTWVKSLHIIYNYYIVTMFLYQHINEIIIIKNISSFDYVWAHFKRYFRRFTFVFGQ